MILSQTPFAFFDFDDTLAKGDSILPYLLYCIRRGMAPKTQLFRAAAGYIRWRLNPACASSAKQATLSFIRGKTQSEMDDLARDFFRQSQSQRFFHDGFKELCRLRGEGYRIVVVSASPEVYMRVLPEFLPVDDVLFTTCSLDQNGCYTGDVGVNCKGNEKVLRIESYLKERGLSIDRAHSRGYGDSPSDAPMLLLTDAPMLVNPKKKLSRRIPQGTQLQWH